MNNKPTIKELFAGNRGTYDYVPLSQEYKGTQKEMTTALDAFLEKLTTEQQEHFQKAYELISENSAVYAEDHFVEGFKFGLPLGIEVGESND